MTSIHKRQSSGSIESFGRPSNESDTRVPSDVPSEFMKIGTITRQRNYYDTRAPKWKRGLIRTRDTLYRLRDQVKNEQTGRVMLHRHMSTLSFDSQCGSESGVPLRHEKIDARMEIELEKSDPDFDANHLEYMVDQHNLRHPTQQVNVRFAEKINPNTQTIYNRLIGRASKNGDVHPIVGELKSSDLNLLDSEWCKFHPLREGYVQRRRLSDWQHWLLDKEGGISIEAREKKFAEAKKALDEFPPWQPPEQEYINGVEAYSDAEHKLIVRISLIDYKRSINMARHRYCRAEDDLRDARRLEGLREKRNLVVDPRSIFDSEGRYIWGNPPTTFIDQGELEARNQQEQAAKREEEENAKTRTGFKKWFTPAGSSSTNRAKEIGRADSAKSLPSDASPPQAATSVSRFDAPQDTGSHPTKESLPERVKKHLRKSSAVSSHAQAADEPAIAADSTDTKPEVPASPKQGEPSSQTHRRSPRVFDAVRQVQPHPNSENRGEASSGIKNPGTPIRSPTQKKSVSIRRASNEARPISGYFREWDRVPDLTLPFKMDNVVPEIYGRESSNSTAPVDSVDSAFDFARTHSKRRIMFSAAKRIVKVIKNSISRIKN